MKKEKKKNKGNYDGDHDSVDISNQERILVKDADSKTLTMRIRSLSLPGSINENVKFLKFVISSIDSTYGIHRRVFQNLGNSLSSFLNPTSSYISPDPHYGDNLVNNSNNYYNYAYYLSYLSPAYNIKNKKHDNLQDSTGKREEVKNPRTQMQNIESTTLSRTYFPHAVSQFIPHPYTSTKAFENTSMTRNASIRLHSDLQANRIANSFSADAVTIGTDIFFAKGKYDISSPQGIALILHEMQHVHQQQTNHLAKANSNTSTSSSGGGVSIPASLSFSLEKEALETEKNVLMYFALYEDYIRRYQAPSSIMMSPTNISINSEMPANYFYPIPKIGYSQSHPLNNVFHSSIVNLYSDSRFGQGNILDSSYGMLMRNGLPNLKTGGLYLESIGVFPDLISSSSSSPIIAAAPSPAFAGHQNINADVTTTSMQSHNLIHKTSAMTPFLADSGRSLPGPAPVHQSPLSPTSSFSSTNANTNMQPILTSESPNRMDSTADLDQLSDRVYQMIMEKIKIQREQRGFR